jgi:hypothetical protein
MLRYLVILFLLSQTSVAIAAENGELQRLQSVLATLNQELQATYHQFEMVTQARGVNQEWLCGLPPALDDRSYDEIIRARDRAEQLDTQLSEQMYRLLAKARDIEAQKGPLLERVYQLISDSESASSLALPEQPGGLTGPETGYGGYGGRPAHPPAVTSE